MVTSGTVSFAMDVTDIIEEAYQRIGLDVQALNGGHFDAARRSLNIVLMKWSLKRWTKWAPAEWSLSTVANVTAYPLPAGTVGLLTEPEIALSPSDDLPVPLYRLDEWQAMTTSASVSPQRPYAAMFDRRSEPAILRVWPAPEKVYTVKGWRIRRLQDAAAGTNDPDIPPLWTPALIADLAVELYNKLPPDRRADALRQDLKIEQAEQARAIAFDNSEPGSFFPRGGGRGSYRVTRSR